MQPPAADTCQKPAGVAQQPQPASLCTQAPAADICQQPAGVAHQPQAASLCARPPVADIIMILPFSSSHPAVSQSAHCLKEAPRVRHKVQHIINTRCRQPISSRYHWLDPEKLEAAKKEFAEMEA